MCLCLCICVCVFFQEGCWKPEPNVIHLSAAGILAEPAEEPKTSQAGSVAGNATDTSHDIPLLSETAEDAMDAQGAEEAQAAEPEAAEPNTFEEATGETIPDQSDEALDFLAQKMQRQMRSGKEFGLLLPSTISIKY